MNEDTFINLTVMANIGEMAKALLSSGVEPTDEQIAILQTDDPTMVEIARFYHSVKVKPEVTLTERPDILSVPAFGLGYAITVMKNRGRVRRTGWNGRGMWLEMQIPDEHSKMTLPYIYMSTVQGFIVPWVASQTDLISTDWERCDE